MSAPDAGSGEQQKSQRELEMETGARWNKHHANPGASPLQSKPDPRSAETGNTKAGIAAATSKEPNIAGIKCETREQPGANAGQAEQSGGHSRETSTDEIARFMARVVPWPENSEAAGFVNLHWTFWEGEEPPKNPPWGGIPTKSVQDFMNALDRVRARKGTRDIYFCLSLQAQTRLNSHGNVVAARSKENALALKAIWLDIDVKEPPKGYAILQDATAALSEFCKSVNLPSPSAVIFSGGGLHVYWISDQSLTPTEWRPYAEGLKSAAIKFGLKCDAGCTTDVARVLRVPGTFNYKKYPKRPVLLEPIDE
jgi:hypothetical protein